MAEQELVPVLRDTVDEISDRKRMAAGIEACKERMTDFGSVTEMTLTGIAMVPEARRMVSDRLTGYWNSRTVSDLSRVSLFNREVIIGGGYHAAVYAACRVLMGYPRPLVFERGDGEAVGGAFAMSLEDVFCLNSRNRPGDAGLPDQEKSLNYLPAGTGIPQLSMITAAEYATNADIAWLIRLLLAQFADVYTGITVTGLAAASSFRVRVRGSGGLDDTVGRVLDARGLGDTAKPAGLGSAVLTFAEFMARMGRMFPLRGIGQLAIIGGGNSGLCAAESALGIAPGSTSPIGLDYVKRVDLYATTLAGSTCDAFRSGQRGRYIRLAQSLEGNVSQLARLRIMGTSGYASPMPGGVIVNDRTYNMAILCTGAQRSALADPFGRYDLVRPAGSSSDATAVASQGGSFETYRIGPAAGIDFSPAEVRAGVSDIPNNTVAMFRLGPRTASLAAYLKPLAF